MQVVKIRVKNYKSIKDSGECNLDDKITILAYNDLLDTAKETIKTYTKKRGKK